MSVVIIINNNDAHSVVRTDCYTPAMLGHVFIIVVCKYRMSTHILYSVNHAEFVSLLQFRLEH